MFCRQQWESKPFYSTVWTQEFFKFIAIPCFTTFYYLSITTVVLECKSLWIILQNKAKYLSCQNKTKNNTVLHNVIIARSDVWSTQGNKINKYILNDIIFRNNGLQKNHHNLYGHSLCTANKRNSDPEVNLLFYQRKKKKKKQNISFCLFGKATQIRN